MKTLILHFWANPRRLIRLLLVPAAVTVVVIAGAVAVDWYWRGQTTAEFIELIRTTPPPGWVMDAMKQAFWMCYTVGAGICLAYELGRVTARSDA